MHPMLFRMPLSRAQGALLSKDQDLDSLPVLDQLIERCSGLLQVEGIIGYYPHPQTPCLECRGRADFS